MSVPSRPVLIVGAGPTGMTAALELSRFGVPVRLIDKAEQPLATSRAIGVQARTLEMLEQRGLAARLVALGNKGLAASLYGEGKRLFRLVFDHIDSRFQYLLFVSQAETEKLLREALEAHDLVIERGVSLIALGQKEATHIDAVLRSSTGATEKFEASYIIDAEGAHSMARSTLDLSFAGKSSKESYALADLFMDGELVDSEFHIFSSEHGFMGLFPLGNRRFRMIAAESTDSALDPSLDDIQTLYDTRSSIPARFSNMIWSSRFHINSRMIHRLRAGRVFFGGDSAHIHSPAGAQGMNTGMQDMFNLAWKLALVLQGRAKPELLDTYGTERLPVITDVLSKTEGLTSAIGSENVLLRSVFSHIAPWIVSTDFVQRNTTERMSQLSINYRGGALSVSTAPSAGLRGGDRVPDLDVMAADAAADGAWQASSLHRLMDPLRFTLLICNAVDARLTRSRFERAIGPWRASIHIQAIAALEVRTSSSADAPFVKTFSKEPIVVMVRPDGYVAFTGDAESSAGLFAYCEKWLTGDDGDGPKNK